MRIGDLVRVLVGDALVHLEEVAVALLDDVAAEAVDGVGEVEVDAVLQRADAVARVDLDLGGPAGDVARREVAEGRVPALEVVVALVLGDLVRRAGSRRGPSGTQMRPSLRSDSDISVSFDWNVVALRDAGRVDLRVAGVGERGAPTVGPPGRR